MNKGRAHTNRTAALLASAAATASLLSGCSMFRGGASAKVEQDPVVPASTVASGPAVTVSPISGQVPGSAPAPTASAPMVSPSLNAYSLAESLESSHRNNRVASDTIVGNVKAIPASATAVGSVVQEMALDTMDSLAQVTFASQGSDFDPAVSRDGQFIVYASTQHRPTADIYMKSVNGRTITQLTADPGQDVMPSVSPDGRRVAFASNRSGSWDVYVMTSNGGQAVQVTSDPAHELHPSWSPDGKRLVYCRLGEVSGRWEMWVADVDQPMASEFIGYGLFPTWCPVPATGAEARDKILFQRSRERGDRAFSVWTVDYKSGDASSPTEIVSSGNAAVINPTWSPDGSRVVYATVPYVGDSGTTNLVKPSAADLWMCGVDGSARVNLTTGRSVNLMPTWGSDGRIYFVSDRGGIENIWSIGTDKAITAATGKAPVNNRETAMKKPAAKEARAEKEETASVETEK